MLLRDHDRSAYAVSQKIPSLSGDSSNFNYYDFTVAEIMGLAGLQLRTNGIDVLNIDFHSMNNTDLKKIVIDNTDEDKALTLTHCRFELSALYGVTDVLVIDPDEFLFFKRGKRDVAKAGTYRGTDRTNMNTYTYTNTNTNTKPPSVYSLNAQRKMMRDLLRYGKKNHLGQLNLHMKVPPYNVDEENGVLMSPSECLYGNILRNLSIFQCYATMEIKVKSFRLIKVCDG